MFALLLTVAGRAQMRINIEALGDSIDLGQDISQLSLSELRILRNAFAARQGYPFMSSELRHIFNSTTWYGYRLSDRSEKVESMDYSGPVYENDYRKTYMAMDGQIGLKYTDAERAFINKVQAREKELLARNFTDAAGQHPNLANLVNPYMLEQIPEALQSALGRHGFAIVPHDADQLFHVYENNDYHDFPSFVTTDAFLQLFHLYFDCMLREVEHHRFFPRLQQLCRDMYQTMTAYAAQAADPQMRDAADYCAAYYAVACALADKGQLPAVAAKYREQAKAEVERANSAADDYSAFLGCQRHMFPYSLFRPRGHYTRTDTLGRYFRAMMWLQSAPMRSNDDAMLQRAALMARTITGTPRLLKTYRQLTDPVTYLMGTPDNITILQFYDAMQRVGVITDRQLADAKQLKRLRQAVELTARQQTRIVPKDLSDDEQDGSCVVNLMPQRYQPDAEVLQEMVDYKGRPTRRKVPTGLDVLASMGWQAAEKILLNEMPDTRQWPDYGLMLDSMKRRMTAVDWQQTVTNNWLSTLTLLQQTPQGAPYFMQNGAWQRKSLNAALASWAELKHDAILYAKQPMGAECGDGGPPAPVTTGYVEPNTAFWARCIALIDATEQTFGRYQLSTPKSQQLSEQLKEMAQFMLNASQKELAGRKLSNEEYDQIEIFGSNCEYLSLQMLKDDDQDLYSWTDVQGTDKSIAVVADVFTASSANVPPADRSILYEAVGPAYEMYVVVPVGGYLYLMRGAVFSYREFQRAMGEPRWTDEEWQQQLKTTPRAGEPQWMQDIIVPINKPLDNEIYFYSSGC